MMIRYYFFAMISGATIMIVGFLYAMYFVGLPYPEMTKIEIMHSNVAGTIIFFGVLISTGAFVAMTIRFIFQFSGQHRGSK